MNRRLTWFAFTRIGKAAQYEMIGLGCQNRQAEGGMDDGGRRMTVCCFSALS